MRTNVEGGVAACGHLGGWRTRAVGVALLAGMMAAGCSVELPREDRGGGTVGASGGQVALGDLATVQVGAGALTGDVQVGLGIVQSTPVALPGEAASDVLELTPHGTQFALPARVAMRYQPRDGESPDDLRVWRLADAAAQEWEPVGGAAFSGGTVTFDTSTFSYYVVVRGRSCQPVALGARCSNSCGCCGTAECVNTAVDPRNCGGCGVACGPGTFCAAGAGGTACRPLPTATLCENAKLVVLRGQLPSLTVVAPEQTADITHANAIAASIGQACGVTPTAVSQATSGVLDACTDAPLHWSGTTLLVVGGNWSQRLARGLERNALAPVVLSTDAAATTYTFRSASGTQLAQFASSALGPRHDYFVIALYPDPQRGALVLQVYGVGWEGTPAAAWYFLNVLQPAVRAGTRAWPRHLLVEWTDNGDGVKGATDTFRVLSEG